MHLIKQDNMYDVPEKLPLPTIINLLTDRKEQRNVGPYNSWVVDPMLKIVAEFAASLKTYPPIKLGTPDPRYTARRVREPSDAVTLRSRASVPIQKFLSSLSVNVERALAVALN